MCRGERREGGGVRGVWGGVRGGGGIGGGGQGGDGGELEGVCCLRP